jgi:TatA/E family protein of Tat protein translocase
MPQLGPLEIAVVLLIALLVFGPNRLPELAKQVGGALRELKRIQQNIRSDLHDMMQDESDGAAPPPILPPKVDQSDPFDASGSSGSSGSSGAPGLGPEGSSGTPPTNPVAPPPEAD